MVDLWTRYGWIRWQDPEYHGYNIRRQTLDPLLRRMTVETPGRRLPAGAVGHRASSRTATACAA